MSLGLVTGGEWEMQRDATGCTGCSEGAHWAVGAGGMRGCSEMEVAGGAKDCTRCTAGRAAEIG